jgi:hypothetical protein
MDIKKTVMHYEQSDEYPLNYIIVEKLSDAEINKLKEDIERGGEIAHKYLKSRKDVEWNKRQFAMGYMDEDEYIFFHLYYYKKQLPFKIQTVKLT